MCFICVINSGCAFKDDKPELSENIQPQFKDTYQAFVEALDKATVKDDSKKQKLVTMSVSGMPFKKFLSYLISKHDISVITDESLDSKLVTIDVVNTDIAEVLSAVARRFSVDITEQGNLYYIGNIKPEDRGFLVRKVRRLNSADLQKVLSSLATDYGRVFASSDGLVVVSDRVRVLQRISLMLDDVEKQPANTWILQLYLISTSENLSKELGFETNASLDVSAVFANSSSRLISDGKFQAILKSARSKSNFSVVAEPMMLIVDGGKSSIKDGENIPIPRKAVSDSGTVTTTGYDYINTGIVISSSIREMSALKASCDINVDLTQVSGYVESSPITSGQTFSTTAIVDSGGTYLVGSMSKITKTNSKSGAFFHSNFKRSSADGNILIWLRCYKIEGSYIGQE